MRGWIATKRASCARRSAGSGFLVGEKDYTLALGKCDRCGTVVEPRLSEQWFIKIKPLADRATEAVESGEITIVPENYRQIYLNWMNNIYDWCISRQLWWGHRIPAWNCDGCKKSSSRAKRRRSVRSAEGTGAGPRCARHLVFVRIAAVHDAGLAGENERSGSVLSDDAADYRVRDSVLLGRAHDHVRLPLHAGARAGCRDQEGQRLGAKSAYKKNDSVPFRQVYIHALVRDAERQKMSKTKGNVVDPLEIIERFGTDATRFTLAAMAAPGTDIAFNESRTEGYRAFANKIWNAARFMFMNVDRIECGRALARVISPSKASRHSAATLEDRWILSRFNRVTKDVNDALETYRFHEAANRIYDFFWGEFCDWYLELIKPRLNFEEGATRPANIACRNLVTLFDAALRLLHPVMPFITEEIWQAIYEGQPPLKSIALAAYPQADEKQFDLTAETEMAILQDLIVSVRNVRAELKVEPKVKVPIEVFAHEPEIRTMIEQNRGAVERLAKWRKSR